MRRKGLNVALTVVIGFVLAALVLVIAIFILNDGLGNLENFFRDSIQIDIGLS